jgi:glycosyltransferase involved in cell wall biosynthesis
VKSPFVSVIIPTYNRLLTLAELMESLTRQTYQNFEVIIVNDAGEKVDRVKEAYSNLDIHVINLEKNSGHVHSRNAGIEQAKGELIMLMDDDDLLVPEHLERMLSAMGDYDLVFADVEIVHFETENRVRFPKERFLFAYELDLEAMRSFSTFVSTGCIYRKAIHERIGLFDPGVHNYWDWDFFLRVSDTFKVNRVPIAGGLYDFSETHNNQSKNLSERRRGFLDKLSEKHQLGWLPQSNFFLLLEQPEVKKRKAESEILWDGKPFISRLALSSNK